MLFNTNYLDTNKNPLVSSILNFEENCYEAVNNSVQNSFFETPIKILYSGFTISIGLTNALIDTITLLAEFILTGLVFIFGNKTDLSFTPSYNPLLGIQEVIERIANRIAPYPQEKYKSTSWKIYDSNGHFNPASIIHGYCKKSNPITIDMIDSFQATTRVCLESYPCQHDPFKITLIDGREVEANLTSPQISVILNDLKANGMQDSNCENFESLWNHFKGYKNMLSINGIPYGKIASSENILTNIFCKTKNSI